MDTKSSIDCGKPNVSKQDTPFLDQQWQALISKYFGDSWIAFPFQEHNLISTDLVFASGSTRIFNELFVVRNQLVKLQVAPAGLKTATVIADRC